jgi:hypothetical protein
MYLREISNTDWAAEFQPPSHDVVQHIFRKPRAGLGRGEDNALLGLHHYNAALILG